LSEQRTQTFANHSKMFPGYHYLTLGLIIVTLLWAAWNLIRRPDLSTAIAVLFVIAAAGTAYYARGFALKVQDRLIRLEERQRMASLFPEDLRGRIDELSVSQMVALRFASDGELADLVREVLDQGIHQRTEIKKKIREWRPDYDRC